MQRRFSLAPEGRVQQGYRLRQPLANEPATSGAICLAESLEHSR
jgi:hypothetical protein